LIVLQMAIVLTPKLR